VLSPSEIGHSLYFLETLGALDFPGGLAPLAPPNRAYAYAILQLLILYKNDSVQFKMPCRHDYQILVCIEALESHFLRFPLSL